MSARYVDLSTNLGEVVIELFEASAPLTVANFLTYVNNTSFGQGYTGSFLHRLVPGFVLQGGGYVFDGTNAFTITAGPPVQNEFSLSNLAYTVAMAKVGGNPNSATNQFFINLANNSANLDSQNGGFTVFAMVEAGSRGVVDAIAALPRANAGAPFDTLPVTTAPGSVGARLVVINSVRTFDVLPGPNYDGDAAANAFFGTNGADLIRGMAGDDTLAGGLGGDTIEGGEGNDFIDGDLLNGTGGDPGNDLVEGGSGDDTLQGGAGTNTLSGGDGNDLIRVHAGGSGTIGGDAGTDTVTFAGFQTGVTFTLMTGAGQSLPGGGVVQLAILEGFVSVENLIGAGFNDRLGGDPRANALFGVDGNDELIAMDGDDSIDGGAGNDTLYGGAGNDQMTGGAGNDVFVVDEAGDVVTEAAAGGTDTVFAGADWTLGAHVELARLFGAGAALIGGAGAETLVANRTASALSGMGGDDTLWGQDGDDTLTGGAGQDTLRGGTGRDTLTGGEGNDQLLGGAGADDFVFDLAAWGYDQIFDFNRTQGDRLDMRGSGASFDTLRILELDGASYILFGTARIDLYFTTTLLAGDFVFS